MATIFNSQIPCLLPSVLIVLILSPIINCNTNIDSDNKRCLDFDLDRIDAICKFQNQSTLLIHGQYYWILEFEPENQTVSLPKQSNRMPIIDLLGSNFKSGIELTTDPIESESKNETKNSIQILSVTDVPLAAINNACVEVSKQTYFYGKFGNGTFFYHRDGPNNEKLSSIDAADFDIFREAKSVKFDDEISAMIFYKDMVVIFQGNNMTSIKCANGKWKEILHKELDEVFSRRQFMGQTPDSAFIPPKPQEIKDDNDELIMFYGRQYISCSVIGVDPCEGPYDIAEEFFNVDQTCPLMYPYQGFNIWSTVALITVAFIIMAIILILLFNYLLQSERLQFLTYYDLKNRKESFSPSAASSARNSRDQQNNGAMVYYSLRRHSDDPIYPSVKKVTFDEYSSIAHTAKVYPNL